MNLNVLAKFGLTGSLCCLLTGCEVVAWVIPPMRVWLKETDGKARFAEAEQDRQIKVREAQAKLDSAKLESQAEVERAKGAAEANKIIGESLKNNEAYLHYLWIQGLNDGTGETIYVPTEANLPILEAGRRK